MNYKSRTVDIIIHEVVAMRTVKEVKAARVPLVGLTVDKELG